MTIVRARRANTVAADATCRCLQTGLGTIRTGTPL